MKSLWVFPQLVGVEKRSEGVTLDSEENVIFHHV